MTSNTEIYEFVKEIEDPDSKETILGFLTDVYKYECPVKAVTKLVDIVFDDEFLRKFCYKDIREFILKMFTDIEGCIHYKECPLVQMILVDESDKEVSIKENIRKKCTQELAMILAVVDGLKKKDWKCMKIKKGIFAYGNFVVTDVLSRENLKRKLVNKEPINKIDFLKDIGFNIKD